MLKYVNVCYVSMLVVVTMDVVEDSTVISVAIAALEVRMLVFYLSTASSTLLQ